LRNILSWGPLRCGAASSILRFNPACIPLKELPLGLPMPHLPALIATLKNRT